jgi:hypothetical protein
MEDPKISIPDPSTEFKLPITNESFEHCIGDVRIEGDGYVVVHGSSLNSAEVRGKQEYSSGKHQLRLKIEKNPSRIMIVIGIISKSTPIKPNSLKASSFYGWASFGHYYLGGLLHRSADLFSIYDNNENDTITLIIDAHERTVRYTNERTKDTQHMKVDINRCPFPWQLYIGLGGDDDQLRILSYSKLS